MNISRNRMIQKTVIITLVNGKEVCGNAIWLLLVEQSQ